MYLWKVYFTNGEFTLIWADGVTSTADTIIFCTKYNKPIARFYLNNIAGYENCGHPKESD